MLAAVELQARQERTEAMGAVEDRWSDAPVPDRYPAAGMARDEDRQRRNLEQFDDVAELVRSWRAGNVSRDYGAWGPDPDNPDGLISDDVLREAWS
jgi:hypothetical protein